MAMTKTILIVDDEANFKDALAFLLKMEGYKTITAPSGRSALKLLKERRVDVVISDIRMPDGDGIELLAKIKENHATAPILILMTGYSALSVEDAYNRGAEAFFSKPIDTKAMIAVIKRLLSPPETQWTSAGSDVEIMGDVEISLKFADLPHAVEAKMVNVGRGGMFVAMDMEKLPKVDHTVNFKIDLKNGKTALEGKGIVRWARYKGTREYPAGCGIEFISLSDANRKDIMAMLSVQKPKAFIPNS